MPRGSRPAIDDDTIRAIIVAPESELQRETADRLGVAESTVSNYRGRYTKRAIRIAEEIGLGVPHSRYVSPLTARERGILRDALDGEDY